MDFDSRLKDARSLAAQVSDWESPFFDWRKAYIASVFSLAAYQHITAFELADGSRANLIPCEDYRVLHASTSRRAAEAFLQPLNPEQFFVIEREHVVVVVARVNDAIFVSFRGTQGFYELALVDLDVRRIAYPATSGSRVEFHHGFANAVSSCLHEVVLRVGERMTSGTKVLLTGHSLGGAMAAIAGARLARADQAGLYAWFHGGWYLREPSALVTCYSFGMPRYGNEYAVGSLACPFHLYNEHDAIPTLPPRKLGFADVHDEYCLMDSREYRRPHRKGDVAIRKEAGRVKLLGIPDHDINRYVERLEIAAKQGITQAARRDGSARPT